MAMATKHTKFDDASYQKVRDFVARRTGLSFPEKKRGELERAVYEALKATEYNSIDDYLEALSGAAKPGEMDKLINLLTVGETYFYRDERQFKLLQNDILPKLISERASTTRRLRIWSAGCATGEEPYSIAITMRELVPYIDTWDTLVLGTDINRESLRRAEAGHYGQWSFRAMPDNWLDSYFFVSSEREFHISEAIKKIVDFDYLNLKEGTFPSSFNNTCDMDLIICRNVSIYFDQKTTDRMMEGFYDSLADGGWLLMGASDPIPPKERFWARNYSGVFIYQKKSPASDARNRERKGDNSGRITLSSTVLGGTEDKRGDNVGPADALAESRALIEVGQPVLAADQLASRLKEEPKSCEALFLMAKAAIARGQLSQAKKWAQKVTKVDKLNVKAYYLLSTIYQGLEDEDRAIECLKKTIYLDKYFIPGHFTLGCLYKKQKRLVMGRKAFKNVVRLMIGRQKDEVVPETNGTTFGQLLEVAEMNLRRQEQ